MFAADLAAVPFPDVEKHGKGDCWCEVAREIPPRCQPPIQSDDFACHDEDGHVKWFSGTEYYVCVLTERKAKIQGSGAADAKKEGDQIKDTANTLLPEALPASNNSA